jgi:cytochrome P450
MSEVTPAASDGTNAAYEMALEDIDVSNPDLFRDNAWHPYFKRLREEDPVHYCKNSMFGPYWSVTKYRDIMAVEKNPKVFSSEAKSGGITIMDENAAASLPMFIAMDPPKHDVQREAVSPIVSSENVAAMQSAIRERTAKLLDGLPLNEEFDWVKRVSIELTTQTLAALFDFPWDDRAKLTFWSDVTTTLPGAGVIDSEEQRMAELMNCAATFTELWNQRVNSEPKNDLISMLAHSESTRNMSQEEFLGNLVLLIVGGNDTTRNSMTGGVVALNEFPDEYRKLAANPALLISSMVPEIIRWQTPLAHMRRTALEDIEFGGKHIRQGDKVVMWYVSGNRDTEAIDDPDTFIIDRAKPRPGLSFGFGIHRCIGSRLAELQLKILWEEILKRWPDPLQLEVLGEPTRSWSAFVKGYESLPVRINA